MAKAPLGAIDPNVRIPAAVRRAGQRADELQAALNAPPVDPNAPPVDPVTLEGNTPPPPAPPVAPPPAPAITSPEPPPLPTLTVQELEGRLRSSQGRYEQQLAANRALTTRLGEVERLLAVMSAPQPAPAAADVRFVTDRERQEYGDETIDVMGRRAKEVFNPEIEAMKAEIAGLKRQLGGVSQVVVTGAREQMHEYFTQNMPKWDEINRSDEFKAWLGLPDPYSGAIRMGLISAAYAANNGPRVLAFFKGFLADEAAIRPATPEMPPEPSKPPQINLAALAAPGRARQTAAPAPAEEPSFSRAEISAFYADVQKGKYAGKDAEKNQIEASIIRASTLGRIRVK